MLNTHTLARSVVGLVMLTGLAACDDSSGVGGPGAQTVNLRFRSASSSAAAFTAADMAPAVNAAVKQSADGLTVTSGDDELVITSAQMVFRNVKLQPSSETCADDDADDESDDESGGSESDDCATMFVGPLLVDIPTDNALGTAFSVLIPEGSYRSVQLRLHKISSNAPASAAFRAANPAFGDASVKVVGTYNDVPFTFLSDVTVTVNLPLPAPIVVGDDEQDLTIELDVGQWFLNGAGTLLSPLSDNNQSRQLIRNNIRTSIRAFRDNNQDGEAD